jgi:hypothetical protein
MGFFKPLSARSSGAEQDDRDKTQNQNNADNRLISFHLDAC